MRNMLRLSFSTRMLFLLLAVTVVCSKRQTEERIDGDLCDICEQKVDAFIRDCCGNFSLEEPDNENPDTARLNEEPCLDLIHQLRPCFEKECIFEPPCNSGVPTTSSAPSNVPTVSNQPTLTAAPTIDCPCVDCTHSSGCNPDPHYYAWDNSFFDFQGGCDQIAIDNPVLQVQMRTRPRNFYSTITEVVVLMKATGQLMRVSATGANSNTIDGASDGQVNPMGNGYQLNFLNAPGSFIRVTNYGGNINLQVQGDGRIFCGSEGMLGSWNYGGVRFRNGALYDTSGGWAATRLTSIALALDWQIPLNDNLLTDPSSICDASSDCGPSEIFDCTDSRRVLEVDEKQEEREMQSTICSLSCDDIFDPTPTLILRSSCEEDLILLSGDNFFTCQPAYTDPIIVVADPNDFDYGTPCADNPPDAVDAILDGLLRRRRRLSMFVGKGMMGNSLQYGGNFDFGKYGKGFSGSGGKGFGKGIGKGMAKGVVWPHPNGSPTPPPIATDPPTPSPPPTSLPTPPPSPGPTLAPIAPLQGCPRLQSLGLCSNMYYLCPVTCGGCLPI